METRNSNSPDSQGGKLHSFVSFERDAGSNFSWTVRATGSAEGEATVYARNQKFVVCGQASFKEVDPHPSAVEYLLGALGGDLLNGFTANAVRRGIGVNELEFSISGRLNNPLVFLGVLGETGDPGFETISGTLYVSAEAEEEIIREVWEEVLTKSPLVNTLKRALTLIMDLKLIV